MVDYILFEKILKSEDCGYIENYDFISYYLLMLFASYKAEKVKSLFKKGEVSLYDVELKCEKCDKMFVLRVTKTKLYKILQHLRGNTKRDKVHILCSHCEQIRKEEENRKTQQQMQKIREIEPAMAKKYIDDYLNPDSHWKNGVKKLG